MPNNCKVNTLTVIKNNIMVTYADCDVFISQINFYVSGLPWVFKRDVFVSQRTFMFQVFLVFPKVTSSFLCEPFCFRISFVSTGDVFVSHRTFMSQDFLVYPTVASSFLRERFCFRTSLCIQRWRLRFSENIYVLGLPVFQLRPLPFSVNLLCLKNF